ncbi:hypothetical protein [Chryseobacterium arachidis]|nr:hypothetical protein [Chryseobacterium arachidis]
MKPLKFKQKGLIFPEAKIQEAGKIHDLYKKETEKQKVSKIAQLSKSITFQYGIEGGIGLKKTNWTAERNPQIGENLGLWISKSFFNSQFFLLLSANGYYWHSSFDLDANKEDTYLNGFYFTEDDKPLLFQRFNNKHFEYVFQLKFIYEWKNIRPFAGITVNRNTYKMQFLVPESNVLNKLDDFSSNQTNIGFSLGLQYRILKRFLLSAEYQQYHMKNISLKNSDFDFDIFKTNNTFAERKINVGISYIISKF